MADMDPLADILNGTAADATDVQANFQILETYINGVSLVRTDGTEVMTADLDMDGNTLANISGLDMNATKITDLAEGTASGDAVNFGQLTAATSPVAIGRVAHNIVTAAQTLTLASYADVTGLTGTWTASASRLYRISYRYSIDYVSGVAQFATAQLVNAANTQYQASDLAITRGGDGATVFASHVVSGLSGSQTFRVRHKFDNATNYTTTSSALNPAYFLVEDIGSA